MANSNDHGCNTVWLVNIDSEIRIALWSHVIYEALTLLGGFVSDTWTLTLLNMYLNSRYVMIVLVLLLKLKCEVNYLLVLFFFLGISCLWLCK